MNERERILALVKQGIISTDEAIELLENTAKKQVEEAQKNETKEPFVEAEKAEPTAEEVQAAADKKDKENFEKILESLASEISYFSSKVDEKTEALQILRRQISAKEERRQAIATHEELGTMTPELQMEVVCLEEELEGLRSQEQALREEKRKMEEQMRTLKKEQLETNVKSFGEKFGNKDEWKETATDLGSKLSHLGTQFSQFVNATVSSIAENLEWKEVDFNVNIPGIVSNKFKHEFNYENTTATILDFQLANGNIHFKQWDKNDMRVEADIKIYAKYEEETPLAAFEARSTITIDEDQLTFHVPNKRVRCDLTVYLPAREYDYLAIKVLNGNVTVNDFKGKDVYLKSTNGNMTFAHVDATMLELDGGNGKITVTDSHLVDILAKVINGDITLNSHVSSSQLSIINGNIRITHTDMDVQRIEASSVNGTVKLAIPAEKSIELDAHSSLGSIKNRMENVEVIQQRDEKTNKHLQLRRVVDTTPVMVELKTTNGSILMKDTDAK